MDECHINLNEGCSLYSNFKYAEAMPFFEKAAMQGSSCAMMILAGMHFNGIGCSKDYNKAKLYYKMAARSNWKSGQEIIKATEHYAQTEVILDTYNERRGFLTYTVY